MVYIEAIFARMITEVFMTLKEKRESYNLSQAEAAKIIGVPVRTLRRYESNDGYGNAHKRQNFADILTAKCEVTEEQGVLNIEQIKEMLKALFEKRYKDSIDFCYLFGSYAKGYASEKSDVDLCVSTSLTGLKVAGLAEAIRGVLHKNIDLVRFETLKDNFELLSEIVKDGIKIYRQQ